MSDYAAILREACLEAARELHPDRLGVSPLKGYCATVSQMLRAVQGGDLMEGWVNGAHHYWNRLSDGREVDLTSCQFGGDGFTPLVKGTVVRDLPELTDLYTLWFCSKVMEKLRGEHGSGSGGNSFF